VLRRVRLDLGAVERHVPELHQTRRLRQPQNLHEQAGQRSQVALAEVRDGAEVGRIAGHDHHEIDPLNARPGHPPRRVHPNRVGIKQQPNHHHRVKRRLAQRALVARRDRLQIQALAHQRHHQARQVAGRDKVVHRRRQQLCLVDPPGAKMLAHGPAQNPTRARKATHYSDRLLGGK